MNKKCVRVQQQLRTRYTHIHEVTLFQTDILNKFEKSNFIWCLLSLTLLMFYLKRLSFPRIMYTCTRDCTRYSADAFSLPLPVRSRIIENKYPRAINYNSTCFLVSNHPLLRRLRNVFDFLGHSWRRWCLVVYCLFKNILSCVGDRFSFSKIFSKSRLILARYKIRDHLLLIFAVGAALMEASLCVPRSVRQFS